MSRANEIGRRKKARSVMVAKVSLEGCFPPIPTPFDSGGRVDHDNLALNLKKWIDLMVFLMGT